MENNTKSVAIIGMSGVFPEASTLNQFHQNLRSGKDMIKKLSDERIINSCLDPDLDYQVSGFLDRVDYFDHFFFNISKKEAELMNPDQRFLLQLVCEAIENAGYSLSDFSKSKVALYLGGNPHSDYFSFLAQEDSPTVLTGNLHSMLAGRISYFLNLNGPTLMIDTSCSSTLVVVHESCEKLIYNDDIEFAIAGGVCIWNTFSEVSLGEGTMGILSPDGRSKVFDANANGTGRGEGGGIVILKRLDKALKDQDNIHAIIKGSAINHDGSRANGITAPSPLAQTEVIKEAWNKSEVNPASIGYIEAHGTGTKLGDPIEFNALSEAFSEFTDEKQICAISAVKSNIGHLNNAAGIAGLIKAVLSLKHKELYPTLHFNTPNPFIDFENSAVYVNKALQKWERHDYPRRCGISSFGLSGTNVHVVLEEPNSINYNNDVSSPSELLLTLSAKTPSALAEQLHNTYNYIKSASAPLQHILYTLNIGRDDYTHRISVTAPHKKGLLEKLKVLRNDIEQDDLKAVVNKQIVLLFSEEFDLPCKNIIETLSKEYQVFNNTINEIRQNLNDHELTGTLEKFTLQYALYKQWKSFGISVKTVIGTGMGRLLKQVVTEELSVTDAIKIIIENKLPSTPLDVKKLKNVVKELVISESPIFLEVGYPGILFQKISEWKDEYENLSIVNTLDELSNKSLLALLSDVYNMGGKIDWKVFYLQGGHKRVDAPTYPFEKIRCWYREPLKNLGKDIDKWFYRLGWEETNNSLTPSFIRQQKLLVFMDDMAIGENLINQLQIDNECIRVYHGNEFKRNEQDSFTISVTEDDYVHLREIIIDQYEIQLTGIIHLGSCGYRKEPDPGKMLKNCLVSQFLVAKTFSDLLNEGQLSYSIVSGNGRLVTAGDVEVFPEFSASHGFMAGLLQEYPLAKVKCIDVDIKDAGSSNTSDILKELAINDNKAIIAYREGRRFVPKIEKVGITANETKSRSVIKEGHVYVITGASSGIGLEIASYLGKNYQIKLGLIGRRQLTPKTEWPSILENKDHEHYQLIRTFKEIEEQGVQLCYYAVDLSNREHLDSMIYDIETKLGSVSGVIHSAGIPGKKRIKNHTVASFTETLEPKIHGTIHLVELLKEHPLDFVALFSSHNAILGAEKISNYSAANIFQDNYANKLKLEGVKAISINWPAWLETGMWQRYNQFTSDIDKSAGLLTREGIAALEMILAEEIPNVIVSKQHPNKAGDNPYFSVVTPENDVDITPQEEDHQNTDNSDTEISKDQFEEHSDWSKIENSIGSIWYEVLKMQNITLDDDFFEIGGHSLNGAQVINRIEKEFNVKLEFEDLFDHSTIRSLGDCLDQMIEKKEYNTFSTIEAVKEQPYYDVSHSQKRLWIFDQFEEASLTFIINESHNLKGNLKVSAFERALEAIVRRHESLRTTFITVEGEPKQKIHSYESVGFRLEHVDLRNSKNKQELVNKFIALEPKTPFDLEKGPLFRARLLHLGDLEYVFSYSVHHIISDGWSREVLIDEILTLYSAFSKGNENPLEPLRIHYKDYTEWQNKQLSGDKMKAHQAYLTKKFSGEIPLLELPLDYPRPTVKTFNSSNFYLDLGKSLSQKIHQISKTRGISTFMTLMATVNTLLHRYSGQDDIIVGIPIAGRQHADLENQIGYYLNTLPIRTQFDVNENADSLLSKTEKSLLEAFEHQVYPFDRLVEDLNLNRDTSRSALFDVLVVSNIFGGILDGNSENAAKELDEIVIENCDLDYSANKFDLTLYFREYEKEFSVTFAFNVDLFSYQRIEQMALHYKKLVSLMLDNIETPLKKYELILEEDKRKLIEEFNNTTVPYSSDKKLNRLFEEQVVNNPNHVALKLGEKEMTYDELNKLSNQLAKHLIDCGVEIGHNVGLITARNFEMIIGMYAILKAGAAYVPIDPEYPLDRQLYIIVNSNISLVLMDDHYRIMRENRNDTDFVVIDPEKLSTYQNENLNLETAGTELAYIIYTSGSTGRPKGVMIKHHAAINLVEWVNRAFDVSSYDRLLFMTSMCFDLSVYDIFGALSAGATVIIAQQEEVQDPLKLQKVLTNEAITFWNSVPTTMNFFVGELENSQNQFIQNYLRVVFLSGDWIPVNLPEKIKHYFPNANVTSLGGATEGTVWSNYYPIEKVDAQWSSIPYGRPIANNFFYILDEELNMVPNGVVGELYIGGVGVSSGYINEREKTDHAFLDDPFIKTSGGKMYRTGDLGRMMPDGNMEFLGRKDHQVKIRGYRVELGEIENVLCKNDKIENAIVAAKVDKEGSKFLAAYYIGNEELSISELIAFCNSSLTNYMVPSYFIKVEEFPLNANGKIDRKLLPNPEELSIKNEREYTAPQNETEKKLINIWKEILGTANIDVNENFFEIGGHSLRAALLVSSIFKELNVRVELRDVFLNPSIKKLAKIINESSNTVYEAIPTTPHEEYYDVSYAQKRLWILCHLEEEQVAYNMISAYELLGTLDRAAFEKAFEILIQRHESLRTTFTSINGEIKQKIHNLGDSNFKLITLDLRSQPNKEHEVRLLVNQEVNSTFDLENGPLINAKLIQVENQKFIFVVTMHHIISDGWSMGVIIKDFIEVYNALKTNQPSPLAQLRVQYKDYAAWQNQEFSKESFIKHKDYWLNKFGDEVPVLDLPTKGIRPSVKTYNGGNHSLSLSKDIGEKLNKLSIDNNATLFMTLMASVYVLLHKHTGQEDLVIGTPVSARNHVDLDNQIGFYANTIPLRILLSEKKSFEHLMKVVKANTLSAFEHQIYPFDRLVDDLNLKRDTSRSPVFDVMVVLQNFEMRGRNDHEMDGLTIDNYYPEATTSKFDFTITFVEHEDGILAAIQYNTDLFSEVYISQMMKHYENIINAILDNAECPIGDLNFVSNEERENILKEFNNTTKTFLKEMTLHELFGIQSARFGDEIAVFFNNESITYACLEEKSNQMAQYLRTRYDIGANDIVGIMLDRSIEAVVAILSVLKSGGAYLPIDPAYPKDRIDYILTDSKAKVLIMNGDKNEYAGVSEHAIIDFTGCSPVIFKETSASLSTINTSNDLAYVIYTSGSTGYPKGVMIEHSGAVNRIEWMWNQYAFDESDVIFHKTPMVFDVSVWEIFLPLCFGAKMVLCEKEVIYDPRQIVDHIDKFNITTLHFVPSMFNMYLEILRDEDRDRINSLRRIIASGEALKLETVKKHYDKTSVPLYNFYGPTEASVDVTSYETKADDDRIAIGKPISNIKILILDKNLKLQPIGVYGEICITGIGLGRGYLNKIELTAEKFIDNPFGEGKLYKTGDIGRWFPDGNIEFRSRKDDQVKIRGFRIELGEIENTMMRHKLIKNAVSVVRKDENEIPFLIAYYTSYNKVEVLKLKRYLKKYLPEYMIPVYFIEINEIPLSVNGKVNYRSLPDPIEMTGDINEYIAPKTEMEKNLVAIWQKVLARNQIGIHDNFFDIGGNSLRIINLHELINKSYPDILKVVDLFDNPSVASQANYLKEKIGKNTSNNMAFEEVEF